MSRPGKDRCPRRLYEHDCVVDELLAAPHRERETALRRLIAERERRPRVLAFYGDPDLASHFLGRLTAHLRTAGAA